MLTLVEKKVGSELSKIRESQIQSRHSQERLLKDA